MILKNIKLSNIRSYVSQGMDFPKGSVLLSGDIGCGKSTILLAIEFALFGIMRADLSGDSLLRHGKDEGSVELRMQIDDKDVLIKRNLKRTKDMIKQDSGYIIIDGEKYEGTPVELKTKVLELLGYPRDVITRAKSLIYRYTVFTPQEQMKAILLDDKEERLDTLRRVFGIDRYKRVAENTSIILRSLKEKSKELSGMIFDLDEKQKRKNETESELRGMEKRMDGLKPGLDSAKKILESRRKELDETEKDIEQLKSLKKELELSDARLLDKSNLLQKNARERDNMGKQILEIKKSISELKFDDIKDRKLLDMPVPEFEKAIMQKDMEIKSLLEQKSELRERIANQKETLKRLKEDIVQRTGQSARLLAMQDELEQLKKKVSGKQMMALGIEKLQDEMMAINLKINEHDINRKNSEKTISNISKLDNCPTCMQPVPKDHKHSIISREEQILSKSAGLMKLLIEEKNAKERELREAKNAIDGVLDSEKKLEAISAEMRNLESLQKEIVMKQKEYSLIDIELIKNNEQLDHLDKNKDVGRLGKELDSDKEILKRLQEKSHLMRMLDDKEKTSSELLSMQDEIKKEIAGINQNKVGLNERILNFKDAEERYSARKKAFDEAAVQERKVEISFAEIKRDAENTKRLLDAMSREIEQKLRKKAELEHSRQLQAWLEGQFVSIVLLMERWVMSKVYNEFNELFQEWFKMLVEDEELAIRLDHDFAPIVVQNGYETSVEHLSGGEKTAIALAYRLSLNSVINDLMGAIKTKDLIILDEPTDGFSSEQLDKVREVIDQLKMSQVIIVSHDHKVEGFVENVIRVEKRGHVSSVVG